MTHKKKIGTVAYYVVGILIAILAIIPFLWMVSTSLKARGALNGSQKNRRSPPM